MRPWRRLSSDAKELWIHGLAFAIAAIIGAILVHPLLPVFEAQTDTRSEALGAYLTCIVIIAGIGPSLTLCVCGSCESSIICEISIDCSMAMHILSLLKL
jgi:hypothetical protein